MKPITAKDLEQTLKSVEKEINMTKMLEAKQPQLIGPVEHMFQNLVMGDYGDTGEMYRYLEEAHGINPNGDFISVTVYLGTSINDSKHRAKQLIKTMLDKYEGIKYCMFELVLHFELVILIWNCEKS